MPERCIADPSSCTAAIARGQAAPFAGQLLDLDLAIALAMRASACPDLIDAEVARVRGDDAADAAAAASVATAERQALQAQIASLNVSLTRAQEAALKTSPPWYSQPWFVAPVAAVAASAVTALVLR